MKKTQSRTAGVRQTVRAAVLAGALLIFGSLAAMGQTSPVDTWDCLISGIQKGVAYITFNSDGTLEGYEVITPRLQGDTLPLAEDRGGDGLGRNSGQVVSVNSAGVPKTNLLGFFFLSGTWAYDLNGKPFGVLTEGNPNLAVCTTNQYVSNIVTSITTTNNGSVTTITVTNYTTNFATVCVTNAITNGVSFTAIAHPGSSLSLKTVGATGKSVYRGVPYTPITTFTNALYANGKKNGLLYTDVFTVGPDLDVDFPNGFDLSGSGPGYEVDAFALVSSRRQIAWVSANNGDISTLSSSYGSVSVSKGSASLRGADLLNNKITYRLFKQTSAGP